jgi:hypothetical protein
MVRTAATSFYKQNPDIVAARSIHIALQAQKTATQGKTFITSFLISAVVVSIWGAALHIAIGAASGSANLEVTLTPYTTALQWLIAA